MGKGTSLNDPVTVEQVPDLKGARHEINEYLHEKGVYDIFDYLLKELMTKQPVDPIRHMQRCLQTDYATGPLKVVVASPPGLGRQGIAKRLAETFGLAYVSAGELLEGAGVRTAEIGYADEGQVTGLVLKAMRDANSQAKGWVLDGFPRTRYQTSFLKEHCMVPAHVVRLEASEDFIRERNRLVGEGEMEGMYVEPDVLEQKLRLHSCHDTIALEVYQDRSSRINVEAGEEEVAAELVRRVRMLPRSRGPKPPPRVVLLGPRGVHLEEHATRLAALLGAVLVDAVELEHFVLNTTAATAAALEKWTVEAEHGDPSPMRRRPTNSGSRLTMGRSKTSTSMDLPHQERMIAGDKLGAVGVRLRQEDCTQQGWVLCGFPTTASVARALHKDTHLSPQRVVIFHATQETCVERLCAVMHDPITGEIYTSPPADEQIRKRLIRQPEDEEYALMAEHAAFTSSVPNLLEGFGGSPRCFQLAADGPPEQVFSELVELVERPLPLPELEGPAPVPPPRNFGA